MTAAKGLRAARSITPAQTEIIHARVHCHESAQKTGKESVSAKTCKQSIRGVVVVYHTCPDVPLAGVVGGCSQTTPRSHQSSYVTVGPRAHVSNQRGCRSGGRTLPGLREQCLGLARRQRSILTLPQPHGHPGRYQTLLLLPCQKCQ